MLRLFLAIGLLPSYCMLAMDQKTALAIGLQKLQLQLEEYSEIKFIGSDGESVSIFEYIAVHSPTLKKLIEDARSKESLNNGIAFNNIHSSHLKLIEKVLKTVDHYYGKDAAHVLQTDFCDNRALLYWLNHHIKPYDYNVLLQEAQYLDLPLLKKMIETKQVHYFFKNDYFKDIRPYLAQFLRNDTQLQKLKQWVLDQTEVLWKKKKSVGEFVIYELINKYSASVTFKHINIYMDDPINSDDNWTATIIKEIPISQNIPEGICGPMSYDGKWIAMNDETTIYIINTENIECIKTLSFIDYGYPIKWSPNNELLVCRNKNIIKIFNIKTNEIEDIDNIEYIHEVQWSPDSKYLAITSKSIGWVTKIWNRKNKCLLKTLLTLPDWIRYGIQLAVKNETENFFTIINLEILCFIDDYFDYQLSFEEIILLKRIRIDSRIKLVLSMQEQNIFNNIAKDNKVIGDAIRNALKIFF